ncbi:MAG TPA: sigma-54 dependent transcriptional regulator [Planctomycetota bacterium]|nr:sigma-54 dependent transcriptional regulator [Planctomycetota bacterium]
MTEPRVLLVDDDPFVTRSLAEILSREGFEVATASDGVEAAAAARERPFDVVIADVNLPRLDGLSLLREIRVGESAPAVVLVTGFGTVEAAVAAMREGAFDFLAKPLVDDVVLLAVRRAVESRQLRRENEHLRARLRIPGGSDRIVGSDPRMQRIIETIEAVAPTRATVLLTGESGTGKTVLARDIHRRSPRWAKPFVEVNCGALPETLLESELFGHVRGAFTGAVKDRPGKFEAAEGGTIFLDEVATGSPALQVKLLRVLQDRVVERVGEARPRHVDVRVLLATNRDLAVEVRAGRFREDLLYRIQVVTIDVPGLRDRPGDIPILAESFLERFCKENDRKVRGFTREAMDALLRHSWPGNVRELENVVERAVVLCRGRSIGVEDLPRTLGEEGGGAAVPAEAGPLPLRRALEAPEKRLIERALATNGGNRQKTAAMLGVNRTTLFNKMRKYGLLRPGGEAPSG